MIHDTTDYGKGHFKYFGEALSKAGGTILGTFGVTSDQQDFTAELTQIKSLNPEGDLFRRPDADRRAHPRADGPPRPQQRACSTAPRASNPTPISRGLGKLAEGSLSFLEGAPVERLPGGKFFLEKYNAQNYPNPPEAYGAFAFAAMNLILDTIEAQGPDRAKVRDALNKTSKVNSIVGEISFDDHGQNTVPIITAYVVQDGQWVVWEDSDYAQGKRKLPGQK